MTPNNFTVKQTFRKSLNKTERLNYPQDFINKIICGDCLEVMKEYQIMDYCKECGNLGELTCSGRCNWCEDLYELEKNG